VNGGRSQEIFGIFLAILGLVFFLVNNHLVWFGWAELWPTLLFLVGIGLLRVFTRRQKPRQLFLGLFLVQFGVFFFLFSSGIFDWQRMEVLWTVIPFVVGVSLISLAFTGGEHSTPAVLFGIVLMLFAGVSYLAETGAIGTRVSEPFVRIWPLVLLAAGVMIYSRAKRERLAASSGSGHPSGSATEPKEPQS
jgi:hypothetical protein